MVRLALLSLLVGVVVGILSYLVGLTLFSAAPGAQPVGAFIMGIAWLFGLIAGVWYFLARKDVKTL